MEGDIRKWIKVQKDVEEKEEEEFVQSTDEEDMPEESREINMGIDQNNERGRKKVLNCLLR